MTAVGIDSKNSPLPGLLLENEIQAGGRRRLHSRISYPSKTLSFPVYPFIHLDYRNVRTRLYGGNGSALLNYKDRSRAFGVGVGLTRWKSFSAEVSYDFEKMDIGPVGVPAQPELTRGLDGRLRKLRIVVTVDTLDSVWLAKKGLFFRTDYEGSYRAFGSDRSYGRAEASVDFYRTFARKHTFRLYGYWGTTSTHVPFYKFLNQGYPLTFVGMKYDQLIGNRMKIIRTDYRYELNNFVHFKVMGNLALGFEQRLPEATLRPNRL